MNQKVRPRLVNVSKHPIMIVGQNPGHFRDGSTTGVAWDGNRSARLLDNVIEGIDNLVLTNVCNHPIMSEENMVEGVNELRDDIIKYKPRKLICLGDISNKWVRMLFGDSKVLKIYNFQHPSYIARFNKDVEVYKAKIREAIYE